MTSKVDIIVPVYNARKYLAKCIRSIQKQTFTDWHLILVDDGSTDGSSEICDCFCAPGGDKRISAVHQENKGSIGARKTGLSNASSDFVAFVDADDLLEPEMLQKLVDTQVEYQADIVCCGYKTLSKRGFIKRSHCNNPNRVTVTSGKEQEVLMASTLALAGVSLWGKLYKRSLFINSQSILETIPDIFWGEDTMINAVIFGKAGKVVLISEELYDYRVGGFSSGASEKTMHELSELYRWRKSYLLSVNADIKYHKANLAQVLNVAVYYAHYSKKTINRDAICKELAYPIADIRNISPNFWHKDAFNVNVPMTDKEFKNLYRESPLVVIKQWLLRIF